MHGRSVLKDQWKRGIFLFVLEILVSDPILRDVSFLPDKVF